MSHVAIGLLPALLQLPLPPAPPPHVRLDAGAVAAASKGRARAGSGDDVHVAALCTRSTDWRAGLTAWELGPHPALGSSVCVPLARPAPLCRQAQGAGCSRLLGAVAPASAASGE